MSGGRIPKTPQELQEDQKKYAEKLEEKTKQMESMKYLVQGVTAAAGRADKNFEAEKGNLQIALQDLVAGKKSMGEDVYKESLKRTAIREDLGTVKKVLEKAATQKYPDPNAKVVKDQIIEAETAAQKDTALLGSTSSRVLTQTAAQKPSQPTTPQATGQTAKKSTAQTPTKPGQNPSWDAVIKSVQTGVKSPPPATEPKVAKTATAPKPHTPGKQQ